MLRAADMECDQAPRERAERHGVQVLTDSELWALILRTGMPGLPITTLTANMMKENSGSLLNLQRRERSELLSMKGVGMVKAIQIEAVWELVRRYNLEKPHENPVITSSKDIHAYMAPEIGNLPHEEIWIILLKRNNQIINRYRITTGSSTQTVYDLKRVMRTALMERAEALIMCHNHPSGSLLPSKPDRDITHKTKEACKMMDISFLDHVIITPHGYYSFHDNEGF